MTQAGSAVNNREQKMKVFNILVVLAFLLSLVVSANAANLQPNYEEQEKASYNWRIYNIIEKGTVIGIIGFYDTGTHLHYRVVNTSSRSYKFEVSCNHRHGRLSEAFNLRPGESEKGEFSAAQLRSGTCCIAMMSVNVQ